MAKKKSNGRTSTVGRGKVVTVSEEPSKNSWHHGDLNLYYGDSLTHYEKWEKPHCIVSDGAYGVLGFEGDTSDHLGLPEWYEPHVKEWAKHATPETTLWFWNSEIGWAAVHPILEKYGWRYVNANIWNKGRGHIAGNVNTAKIRRFPVVTEICVQYVFEAKINGLNLKDWLRSEWQRTGLPFRLANDACGVKDAAVRKYLDKGHLWYFPPAEMFEKMQAYANLHGEEIGKPYFSIDGKTPATAEDWERQRSHFQCPYGHTNVWERPALRGKERVVIPGGKAVHLNQKPLDLMKMIIEASTSNNNVVWEPFGGLFSASLASAQLGRKSFAAEIDSAYYQYGVKRLDNCIHALSLLHS